MLPILGQIRGESSHLYVSIGDSVIEEVDGRYHVNIKLDGLCCELEYIPRFSPWAPLPGRNGYMNPLLTALNQRSLANEKYFQYVSLVPRARLLAIYP